MKNWKLKEVAGKTYKDSNAHVLVFMFEPDGAIIGSRGKVITVKIGIGSTAMDLADNLIKAGQMIYEELKKG